jgi:hypothetical protein
MNRIQPPAWMISPKKKNPPLKRTLFPSSSQEGEQEGVQWFVQNALLGGITWALVYRKIVPKCQEKIISFLQRKQRYDRREKWFLG